MPPVNFDPWDQAQLTDLIERSLTTLKENSPSLADSIAPFVDVRERRVKYMVLEVDAFGIGQLRAPDANPPLFRTKHRVREEYIELALPDEMERLTEDVLDRLDSTDQNIRMSAGASITTRGRVLALRSARRVEKMRWDMLLTGSISLPYEDGTVARVDFPLPASHKVTAGTLWTDTVNADIVGQVRAWQKAVADDIGEYALKLHMNTDTWELVYNNAKIRALLSTYGRSLLVPTKDEVAKLFREGTEIIIYDGGYRDTIADAIYTGANPNFSRGDGQLTKWLPYGKVLLTAGANYTVNGEKIADTPNGRVRIAVGYNTAVWKQGPQAETILEPISKNEMLRYARANIPRLLVPEAVFVATVA